MADRQWIIGSDLDVDLHINDSVISRRHCRLSLHANEYFIEDLASRNGTFLNNERVVKQMSIQPGAKILMAGSVLMPWPDEKAAVQKIRIGRAASNDVVIDDDSVSSNHAVLFRDSNDVWIVRDLNSTNGTRVGDSDRVPAAARVTPSDVIRFGNVAESLSSLQRRDGANPPVAVASQPDRTTRKQSNSTAAIADPRSGSAAWKSSRWLPAGLAGGALLIGLGLLTIQWQGAAPGQPSLSAQPPLAPTPVHVPDSTTVPAPVQRGASDPASVSAAATPSIAKKTGLERVRGAMFVIVAQYTGGDGREHDVEIASAWAASPEILIANARLVSTLLSQPKSASVVHAQSGVRLPITAMGQHADFKKRGRELSLLLQQINELQTSQPSSVAEADQVRGKLNEALLALPHARADLDAVDAAWIQIPPSSQSFDTIDVKSLPRIVSDQSLKMANPSVYADVAYAGLQNHQDRAVRILTLVATQPVLIQSDDAPRRWKARIDSRFTDYQDFIYLGCPVVDPRGGLLGMYRGPIRNTTAKASDPDPIAQLSDEFDMVPSAAIANLLQQIPPGMFP